MIIADDEPFNITALLSLLKVMKMKDVSTLVDVCHDGSETVELLREAIRQGDPCRYSLILTDLSMPGMDGYTSASTVRDLLKDYQPAQEQLPLTIVSLTGHAEQEIIMKAEQSGIDQVLCKPIKPLELAKLLLQTRFISELPRLNKM